MFHFRNYFSDILRPFSIVDVSLLSSVTHGLHARTSCETKTSEQLFLTTSWNYVNPAALHENLIAQVKINKLLLERGGRKEKKYTHLTLPGLKSRLEIGPLEEQRVSQLCSVPLAIWYLGERQSSQLAAGPHDDRTATGPVVSVARMQ